MNKIKGKIKNEVASPALFEISYFDFLILSNIFSRICEILPVYKMGL
jgi:hypothetical protein